MVFPFNFDIVAPGLSNPFTAATETHSALPSSESVKGARGRHTGPVRRDGRAPSPSLLPPLAKKRGWVPSNTDISHATAMHTSTSGYLDTPAKYRDMMANTTEEDEIDEMVADLPPPKRRRGLAGSIVSTAFSAALIGTAVGLTVYRLWRDRSKQPEALPPPPYEQGEWIPSDAVPVTQVTPPTPRSRKSRHVAGRRTVTRHRKAVSRAAIPTNNSPTVDPGFSGNIHAPIPSEFDFAMAVDSEPAPDPEDQMSWMGDRLASLIAEGQRALGTEVVIMSEGQDDSVDDGSDGWVEDDERGSRSSRNPHRHGSLPPSYHGALRLSPSPRTNALSLRGSPSPRSPTFDHAPLQMSTTPSLAIPRRLGRESSVESDGFRSVHSSYREDEAAWETPEMRTMMERARQRYLGDRA